MSEVLISPDSTVDLGGATVVGASSASNALRDGVDSSYVILKGTHTGLGFPTPSVPSGARVTAILALTRLAALPVDVITGDLDEASDEGVAATLRNNLPDIPGHQDISVTWRGPIETWTYISGDAEANGAVSDWEFDLSRQAGPANAALVIYKLQLLIAYVTRPVVTVTRPTSPITNTSFPLVTWDVDADPDGGAVDQAEIKIFNDAQYGALGFSPGGSAAFAESGLLDGSPDDVARSWRTTTKLPNDTYRAYVRTRQNPLSNWSNWAFIQWVENVVPPAPPNAVTLTPESAQARIRIDVDGTDAPRSVDAIEVERSKDGGATWEPVRPFAGGEFAGVSPVGGDATVWDWESPNGVDVIYRVRTLHAYALGEWAASDWVASSAAHWESAEWLIKHPTIWELNRTIKIRSQASSTRVQPQGIFKVLDRDDPIVISGGKRQLPAGELIFRSLTEAEQLALDALLDTDAPLLLQAPPGAAWPDRWLRLGDHTRERLVDAQMVPVWDSLPWQQVARPEGELTPIPAGGPTHLTLPFTLSGGTHLH